MGYTIDDHTISTTKGLESSTSSVIFLGGNGQFI